ncbi:MAG: CHASE domain-containing protein [Phycisphaera sp.]|nr:MAG: CHASE domain-containing protein [Phycisphaera sp.]
MSHAVRLIGVIACGVTALVMLAWKFHWESVTSLLPGLPAMTFNTALGLCLGGVSLLCLNMPYRNCRRSTWPRRLALVAASLAGVLALLTITEMVAGVNLGIDELFAIDTISRVRDTGHLPGRMSQATALAMLLMSVPLALCSTRNSRESMKWLASAFTMGTIAIGFMAGASSLIDDGALWSVPFFSTMALHTSWLFVLLGASTFMTRVTQSNAEVAIARRPKTRARLWLAATVVLVFAIGIAMTALVSKRTTSREIETAQIQFERLTDRVIVEAGRRVYLPVYGLKGARGMYAGSEHVSRLEFRDYVKSRDLAEEFPGTIGMGFIERVPKEELEQFLARERADHAPEYRIKTVGEHDVLYPIKFIDPLEDNMLAWGYDVGSESNRRNAVETAIWTGEPTLTHRITLVQDKLEQPGVRCRRPFFVEHDWDAIRPGLEYSDGGLRLATWVRPGECVGAG